MTWIDFVVLWESTVNSTIPKDANFQWQRFVKSANDGNLTAAVKMVAEKFFENIEKHGIKKNPVLSQLVSAYNAVCAEQQAKKAYSGCDFCEHEPSATVHVLDNGIYDESFPPDPETWNGRRAIGSVPCPCCRANEYGNQVIRERVRRYSRPWSRRNELFHKPAEVTA